VKQPLWQIFVEIVDRIPYLIQGFDSNEKTILAAFKQSKKVTRLLQLSWLEIEKLARAKTGQCT
jgi:hypothetical protein